MSMMRNILQKDSNENIRKHNQGNSYIMVVATLSFLAVLVAAILVAVALCYRLKAYDINARDNFYYLEQAMDEIYAGVGTDSMNHLVTAYEDTLQVLVYFDSQSQSYVTMKNTEANRILKNTFIKLVKEDANYADSTSVKSHLSGFITYPYKADGTQKDKEGIQISVGNIASTDDSVTIMNLVLKREATYSTVNTRKSFSDDGKVSAAAGDTFVQTITTDLVIGKPEFDVNFNTVGSELNDLYQFAMVADLGVEISGATSNVNITGNVYAASDYYNKDYNITDEKNANYIARSTDKEKTQYAAVSEYDWSKASNKDKLKDYDGLQEKSMYSGLYIDGASVRLTSDKVVVPGTIAAFNAATLSIAGTSASATNTAEIWADSIVLGGYSLKKSGNVDELKGSDVAMRANAYIYDDLELNAASSSYQMIGQYYGYNYSTLDNRTYTDTSVMSASGRTFAESVNNGVSRNADNVGKAHYNSSAVIVNGENSSLDLSQVTDMYIAGQAYIELSKKKTTSTKEIKAVVNEVVNKDGTVVSSTKSEAGDPYNVEQASYSYPEKTSEEVKENVVTGTTEDEQGNTIETTEEVTKTVYDNYTTNSGDVANKEAAKTDADKAKYDSTNIQDYRTGEAISIKSNQLAYLVNIPSWEIVDNGKELYLKLPKNSIIQNLFKEYWDLQKNVQKIPIVKSVISGKTYYFFDFSDSTLKDAKGMNEFIEAYASLFEIEEGATTSDGENLGLNNITDYDFFSIKMSKVNDTATTDANGNMTDNYKNIYSNSAISIKDGTTFKIIADSDSVSPLLTAAAKISNNVAEQNKYHDEADQQRQVNLGLTYDEDNNTYSYSGENSVLASKVTTELQSQYKEMRWMLTTTSRDYDGVSDAHAMSESDITPINYFFYFNKIASSYSEKLSSGYKAWVSDKSLTINDKGDLKGLIICKGDVTFDKDVKSFEGLIVSGGKIKIDHSMNISSNEEIIKSILRECDESQKYGKTSTKNLYKICELFQKYQSIYVDENNSDAINVESTKSISAVQFEDILAFDNWKKNVD